MADGKDSILIVDDTPENVASLESILREQGYKVRAAISGELAIKSARSQQPDLILLDVNMPVMNGYEVCRTLKADEFLAKIPVVFVSAASDTENKLRAFEEGGVDYVTKPFQASEVLARVKTHLALANARRELEQKNNALRSTMQELKQAQAQLVQSEKMAALGMLTAGIAHELNNPLNFIAGGVQALKTLLPAIDELIHLCETSHSNCPHFESWIAQNPQLCQIMAELVDNSCYGANRAAEIVKGLRTFSRVDEAALKSTNINENLDSVLLLLHSRYKNKIKVTKQYGELPTWVCQPGKLNQVFLNLVANAIDAINAKSELTAEEEITITTRMENQGGEYYAVIEVADTGIGMTDEVKQQLFQPFFTTKDVGEGVGLGLAIAHGIVQEHRGTIEVESCPDRGSLFRVVLPQDTGRR